MLFKTLFTTGALALTANAFLVPIEVAEAVQIAKALANTIIPSEQSVNVDCSTCPLAVKDSRTGLNIRLENAPKSDLQLTFSTSEDRQSLSLNGVNFFPATYNNLAHPVKTKQVIKPGEVVTSNIQPFDGELGLSYSLEVKPDIVEEGLVLTPLYMQILGLDGKMINVDTIIIPILKMSNGDLALAEIKTTPSPVNPGEDQCTTIMCRIRAILMGKLQAARLAAIKAMEKMRGAKNGCMRKLGFKVPAPAAQPAPKKGPKVHGGPEKFKGKVPAKDAAPGEEHEHKHGHGGKPHGPKKNHHGKKSFWCSVKRVLRHIVLPVFIGIAAGMAASAVGMVIGQLVIMLWARYRRASGRGTYAAVEQTEEQGLPKYDDVVEGEEEVNEKKELLS